MNTLLVLIKAMNRSNGAARVVKVPDERIPDYQQLKKLETEISAQITANEAMRNRSILNASKC